MRLARGGRNHLAPIESDRAIRRRGKLDLESETVFPDSDDGADRTRWQTTVVQRHRADGGDKGEFPEMAVAGCRCDPMFGAPAVRTDHRIR